MGGGKAAVLTNAINDDVSIQQSGTTACFVFLTCVCVSVCSRHQGAMPNASVFLCAHVCLCGDFTCFQGDMTIWLQRS